MIKRWVASLLLLALAPIMASADGGPSEDDRIDFVVGNVAFVLLHEFGHLVVDDFKVPILGNPEDAADTLAAVAMIRLDRTRPERDFAFIRMLLMAADANRILWERGLERDNPSVYQARHPLSVQRATRIACLVYGSDPELLEPLPQIVGMAAFRADWCEEEFAEAETAYDWVRDSYVKGTRSRKTEHGFEYGAARAPARQRILERMRDGRVLERVLALVSDNILLPDSIVLRTSSCGSPDAYWDSNAREVLLCYELVEGFYALSAEQKIRELEARIREFRRDAT